MFLSVTVTSPIGDIGSYASCRQLASVVIKELNQLIDACQNFQCMGFVCFSVVNLSLSLRNHNNN